MMVPIFNLVLSNATTTTRRSSTQPHYVPPGPTLSSDPLSNILPSAEHLAHQNDR